MKIGLLIPLFILAAFGIGAMAFAVINMPFSFHKNSLGTSVICTAIMFVISIVYFFENDKWKFVQELICIAGGWFGSYFLKVFEVKGSKILTITFISSIWPLWYIDFGFHIERNTITLRHFVQVMAMGIVCCLASVWLHSEIARAVFNVNDFDHTHYLALGAIYSATDPTYATKLLETGSMVYYVLMGEYILSCGMCSIVALQLDSSMSTLAILSVAYFLISASMLVGFMVGIFISLIWNQLDIQNEPNLRTHTMCLVLSFSILVIGVSITGIIEHDILVFAKVFDISVMGSVLASCFLVYAHTLPINMLAMWAKLVDASFFLRIGLSAMELNHDGFIEKFGDALIMGLCLTFVNMLIRGIVFFGFQCSEYGWTEAWNRKRDLGIILFAGLNRGSTPVVIASSIFQVGKNANQVHMSIISTAFATNMISAACAWYFKVPPSLPLPIPVQDPAQPLSPHRSPSQPLSPHRSPSQSPSTHRPPSQSPSTHRPPSQSPSTHRSPSRSSSSHRSPSRSPSSHRSPSRSPSSH